MQMPHFRSDEPVPGFITNNICEVSDQSGRCPPDYTHLIEVVEVMSRSWRENSFCGRDCDTRENARQVCIVVIIATKSTFLYKLLCP
jgi:hypothetical protein